MAGVFSTGENLFSADPYLSGSVPIADPAGRDSAAPPLCLKWGRKTADMVARIQEHVCESIILSAESLVNRQLLLAGPCKSRGATHLT
jgi:hypothetical protein